MEKSFEATQHSRTFETTLRHAQFGMLDALRHMQGDLLGSLGYGPVETPYRVIASGPYWRLRQYNGAHRSPALLVVAAPIKRPYIWDLAPEVSVIRRCLGAGLRVYLLEWLPASQQTCGVGILECVEAISESLAAIAGDARGPRPTLMGHSLGGTLAAIYAAAEPQTIGNLVVLGAPLCFRPGESAFRDALIALLPERVSESEPYPGSLISQASAAASPETFVWSRLMDAVLSAADSRARDVHARVERWALDEVALPGKLVGEIVEWLYRENRFCRGMLKIGERRIGLEDLAAPALAVVNVADAVAPLDSVSPIAEILGSPRFRIIEYPGEAGVCLQHLGILVGRDAHARIWPQIIEWIGPQDEREMKLQ